MIIKKPASTWNAFVRKLFGYAILGEVACFGITYYFWNRLNRDQELRFYTYQNYNFVVEGYYRIGEQMSGNTEQRDSDLRTWKAQNKI